MILKVLIACEESQAICKEFRKLGHEAFSCDVLPCSGGHPEWHIRYDVIHHLNDNWDLIIAHPPCQYLSVSGARWLYNKDKTINKDRKEKQEEALKFFQLFLDAPCKHIAVENPISIVSTRIRKPDQIVQPWWFGDPYQKSTALWLKNLPLLKPTKIVDKGEVLTFKSGRRMSKWMAELRGNGHLRAKTFPGFAGAVATQWSEYIINEYKKSA